MSEHRRSQRVIVVVSVQLAWTKEDGQAASVRAETEVVSAHGALLRTKPEVMLPLEFEITNPGTHQTSAARLVASDQAPPNPEAPRDKVRRFSVELSAPSETFWGIRMPN